MLASWIVASAILPSATVTLDIFAGSQRVGEARVTSRVTPSGGKATQMHMSLAQGAQKSTVVEESEYASDGAPIRKYFRKIGGGSNEMVTATFDSANANVVTEKGGERSTKTVAVPSGADIRAACELWFIKTQPPVGAEVAYVRFDLSKLEWVAAKAKFVKKEKDLNLVEHDTGKAWLDSSGNLARLEAGRILFKRKPK
jgi:hypothetical protein